MKKKTPDSARNKFLSSTLESSRKSYYPQLLEKLEDARKNEQRLQLLIDSLPVRISYVNTKERYILVNNEYVNLFKKDKNAIIGNSIEDILGEENYKHVKPYIQKVLVGNEVHFETPFYTPDGNELWNEISYIPVFNTSEQVEGFYILARDLTSRKRSEEEKKKLELRLYETEKFKTIGTLAGGVAHDFNNLLTGILGHASLMETKIDPSNPLSEHVRAIGSLVKSATSLTEQLLGLSRGGKYDVKPININDLVLNNSNMFGRTRKEVTIHHEINQKSIVAEVDRNQIEQVLLNLFINAWQAMPNGGDLYLATKVISLSEKDSEAFDLTPGNYVCISVTDTGIGMPPEVRQRVFDPFFTTKEKQRGTGLGLASAYGIIKNHEGSINVYSEIDKGTTFHIYLPLSNQHAHPEAVNNTTYIEATGTVLLIDDEKHILDIGKSMLKTIGYTAITAESGQDAIQYLSDNVDTVDLVIIDMIMPGIDGEKTFEDIREAYPSLPIILSSGYSQNDRVNKIMQKGCDGFLKKPFTISDLSLKITESMATSYSG